MNYFKVWCTTQSPAATSMLLIKYRNFSAGLFVNIWHKGLIQSCFENLHGGGFHWLSRKHIPVLNHLHSEEFFRCPIRISLAATCDCCVLLSHHGRHCLSAITMYLLPPTTSQQEFLKIYWKKWLYFLYLRFQLRSGFQCTLSIIPNSHMPLKELAADNGRLQTCPNILF